MCFELAVATKKSRYIYYTLPWQCLKNIFPLPSSRVKFLVAFGDNDIGGEGRDKMTEQVVG